MIIIADSHVSEESESDFFYMLDLIGNTDEDVVFIGDIFDLWIAIPRYQKKIHDKFTNWCCEEKKRRVVGLIEGNHEFFAAKIHEKCFTWADGLEYQLNDKLFIHGDMINENDRGYRLLRFLSKNILMKTIFTFMPKGELVIKWLEEKIGKINPKKRYTLPEEDITEYASKRFSSGLRAIFMGHFHQQKEFRYGEKSVFLLPAFMNSKEITVFDEKKGTIEYIHYKKYLEKEV